MNEIWKDIEGYEGLYQVSNLGRVKSLARHINAGHKGSKGYDIPERIMIQSNGRHNYKQISFHLNGKLKTYKVHRLVAKAFIPNPENKEQINHINGDKENNRIDNLEWSSCCENIRHSYNILKRKGSNRRKVLCIETGKVYDNSAEASRAMGVNRMAVGQCARGDKKTAAGYHWRYIDEKNRKEVVLQ